MHEGKISDLTQRLGKVESLLGSPQALGVFLKDCAKDSRNFDAVFAEMFCRFMNENAEVKEAVCKKMNETDRNFFFKNFRRLWLPVYSGVIIICTVLAKEFVQWIVSLFHNK